MPPLKQKYKAETKDTRSPEEIAIQSASHSHYHLMIPMYNAEHVTIKNPVTKRDHHFPTNDPRFYEMFYDLSKKGLHEKLMSDLFYFAENYDPSWTKVIESLNGYFKVKDKDVQEQ